MDFTIDLSCPCRSLCADIVFSPYLLLSSFTRSSHSLISNVLLFLHQKHYSSISINMAPAPPNGSTIDPAFEWFDVLLRTGLAFSVLTFAVIFVAHSVKLSVVVLHSIYGGDAHLQCSGFPSGGETDSEYIFPDGIGGAEMVRSSKMFLTQLHLFRLFDKAMHQVERILRQCYTTPCRIAEMYPQLPTTLGLVKHGSSGDSTSHNFRKRTRGSEVRLCGAAPRVSHRLNPNLPDSTQLPQGTQPPAVETRESDCTPFPRSDFFSNHPVCVHKPCPPCLAKFPILSSSLRSAAARMPPVRFPHTISPGLSDMNELRFSSVEGFAMELHEC
jgi:hypothetical protein